jgi:hypothetical protein
MNIILETTFKKNKKTIDTLSVELNVAQLAKLVESRGITQGNQAIDNFVAKYTTDIKKKLAAALKS